MNMQEEGGCVAMGRPCPLYLDKLTSRAVHKSKIAVIEDYIVFPASR